MLSSFDLEGKNRAQKAAYYLRYYGAAFTVKKALRKLGVPVNEESAYMTWCRHHNASKKELSAQKKSARAKEYAFVIVAEEGVDVKSAGWQEQTCKRISFARVTGSSTISDLLARADGDIFVFCGEAVRVRPEYLYEISLAASGRYERHISRIRKGNDHPADLLYTDEDNCTGKKRSRPFFKPDASEQLLLNFPYLGRCFAVRRSLLEAMERKGTSVQFAGNDWYDLSLQAFRHAEHILHLPKVLFSNVVTEEARGSFTHSVKPENAGCLRRWMTEEGIRGTVEASDVPGFFHIRQTLEQEPLVSIIIPNKDHLEDLTLCLNALKRSDYTNFEIIIAENNSEREETFAFYEALERQDKRVRIVTWNGSFNYSAINNFAVQRAKGELLLFLNNDTECMDAFALRELVASALKPGVGACGAMLYYGDRTIQHAGVIIGMGGFAAHALWSLRDRDAQGYPFALCEREVSGVTGACFMVRRAVYEEVGGMEEDFVVALNDVDLAMKIRAAGYKILFNPYARLYHYESKSRGYEDTVEKQARFQTEIDRFQSKWEREITEGDPYYNPNLTLHRADYTMDL